MSAASDDSSDPEGRCRLEATPAPVSNSKLIVSGGEGYVDFRMGNGSVPPRAFLSSSSSSCLSSAAVPSDAMPAVREAERGGWSGVGSGGRGGGLVALFFFFFFWYRRGVFWRCFTFLQ